MADIRYAASVPSPVGHALGALAAGWLIAGPAPAPFRAAAEGGLRSIEPGRGPVPAAFAEVAPGGWRLVAEYPNLLRAALFGLIGVVADLDLLFGMHSSYTHSVGAAVVAGVLFVAVPARSGLRRIMGPRLLFAAAAAAAYLTHPILDWLGQDDNPPIGVMLLWPFTSAYFHSGLDWFQAISRRYWLPGFWMFNLRSIGREVLLLGPPAVLALLARRPTGRSRQSLTNGPGAGRQDSDRHAERAEPRECVDPHSDP